MRRKLLDRGRMIMIYILRTHTGTLQLPWHCDYHGDPVRQVRKDGQRNQMEI